MFIQDTLFKKAHAGGRRVKLHYYLWTLIRTNYNLDYFLFKVIHRSCFSGVYNMSYLLHM